MNPRSPKLLFVLLMTGALAVAFDAVRAEEGESYTTQPYIDAVKERLEDEGGPARTAENPEPFIDSVKKDLPPEGEMTEGYTDMIKRNLREEGDEGSYISREKARLGPAKKESAIGKVYEGNSELSLKRDTEDISHAAGFRLGTAFSFDISGPSSATSQSFTTVYGEGWNPDFTLFYEYQPFHSEWVGNFGLWGSVGFSNFSGSGVFTSALPQPWPGGGTFSTTSRTKFNFTAIPVMIGANFRLNVLRVLRPYVMAAPALIGYLESRNDGGNTHHGTSRAVYFSGGVALLLDWLSKNNTWDLYQEFGVRHFYLTVEYANMSTFSGDVDFAQSGVFTGLTFEF